MGDPLNVDLHVDVSFEEIFNADDPFPPELEPRNDYDSDSGGEETNPFTFQITERARRKAIEKRQR